MTTIPIQAADAAGQVVLGRKNLHTSVITQTCTGLAHLARQQRWA